MWVTVAIETDLGKAFAEHEVDLGPGFVERGLLSLKSLHHRGLEITHLGIDRKPSLLQACEGEHIGHHPAETLRFTGHSAGVIPGSGGVSEAFRQHFTVEP